MSSDPYKQTAGTVITDTAFTQADRVSWKSEQTERGWQWPELRMTESAEIPQASLSTLTPL